MKQKLRFARPASLIAVLAFALLLALVGASATRAATPSNGRISVHPEISAPQTARPGSQDTFGCQARPIDGSKGARCYSPQQLQQAYGFSGLLASGVTGKGKTIVIVDAFSNPYIQQDLDIEDATFGLPPATVDIVAPQTVPAFDFNDPNMVGWAGEISLDVLSAHAMAPDAKIVLVEGSEPTDAALYAAEKYAVDNHLGDVMSQSFGEADSCIDPAVFHKWHALYQKAAAEGWTTFASSGDSGAAQFNCDGTAAILAASWPASDPNVTGVGGTTLSATNDPTGTATTPSGTYLGETAWTEIFGCNPPAVDPSDVNCSGGGFSSVFRRPAWQASSVKGGQPHAARGVPDVAYDAGVNGGLLIHSGVLLQAFFGLDPSLPAFFIFGGTSAGSPQWAALAADAGQMAGHDLGNINPVLYRTAQSSRYAANFHDITTGNNDVAELGGQGFDAVRGWDPVTGLGSPNAANLIPTLAKRG